MRFKSFFCQMFSVPKRESVIKIGYHPETFLCSFRFVYFSQITRERNVMREEEEGGEKIKLSLNVAECIRTHIGECLTNI